jgi:Protein of unknown function (DUF3618)
MGQATAETVREIEQTRARLGAEVEELQRRLPAPAVWGKRLAGIIAGGGMAGAASLFLLRRVRSRQAKERELRAVINVLPDARAKGLTKTQEDAQWRQWAAIGFGVWVLLRIAEIRHLRRANKLLMVRAT